MRGAGNTGGMPRAPPRDRPLAPRRRRRGRTARTSRSSERDTARIGGAWSASRVGDTADALRRVVLTRVRTRADRVAGSNERAKGEKTPRASPKPETVHADWWRMPRLSGATRGFAIAAVRGPRRRTRNALRRGAREATRRQRYAGRCGTEEDNASDRRPARRSEPIGVTPKGSRSAWGRALRSVPRRGVVIL